MLFGNLFVQFLEESVHMYDDNDLFCLYKTYNSQKRNCYITGKMEEYKRLCHIVSILKQELLRRCWYGRSSIIYWIWIKGIKR